MHTTSENNVDSDSDEPVETILADEGIAAGEKFLKFMEQCEYFTQQEVMNVFHYVVKSRKKKLTR